ncbi:MAG: WXG100 family type VII secretion target [Carbonactinosporaceae bacterium]
MSDGLVRAIIPGDPASCRDEASRLDRFAESVRAVGRSVSSAHSATWGVWQGTAADAARATLVTHSTGASQLAEDVGVVPSALRSFADEIEGAQRRAQQAIEVAGSVGASFDTAGLLHSPMTPLGPTDPAVAEARASTISQAQWLMSQAREMAQRAYDELRGRVQPLADAGPPSWVQGLGDLVNRYGDDVALGFSGALGLLRMRGVYQWSSEAMGLARAAGAGRWWQLAFAGGNRVSSLLPTLNNGLGGRVAAGLLSRIPGGASAGSWLSTASKATPYFRWGGAALSAATTVYDGYKLVTEHPLNPIEAVQEDGADYVADLGKTAFGASTTAFFVAPNPVTAGAVVVSGAVWLGAEGWKHYGDEITAGAEAAWDWTGDRAGDVADFATDTWNSGTELAGDAWDAGTEFADDALATAGDVASDVGGALNPFD